MNWAVIGINHQHANLEVRQKYALNDEQILKAYRTLRKENIHKCLIISTCNRTEFFFQERFTSNIKKLIASLYSHPIDTHLFHYKLNQDAIEYFFRICSGLESQIPGDFEILGQVKRACTLAKKNEMISGTWEKVINSAIAAAKKARTKTGFYSGASSTSYAGIEYLKQKGVIIEDMNYLILGAGKIGGHSLDHLLKRVNPEQITLSNRTISKAQKLAEEKGIQHISFEKVADQAHNFDVIICATHAPNYIIEPEMLDAHKEYFIIDLSVPLNINPEVANERNVDLVNVDELSITINKNIKKRVAERSNVEHIIQEHINDFNAWFTIKSGIPLFKELKFELDQLKVEALANLDDEKQQHTEEFLDRYTDELFNQISLNWMKKVRNRFSNVH